MQAGPCLGRALSGRARVSPAGLAHLENFSLGACVRDLAGNGEGERRRGGGPPGAIRVRAGPTPVAEHWEHR